MIEFKNVKVIIMKNEQIRKVTIISSLIAIGVILSIVDKLISSIAFPFLPMAKIGLANIVILIGVYNFKIKDVIIMALLKSVLTGLIFGSLMSFFIGASGTILSVIAMLTIKKTISEKISPIGVSMIGGSFHIFGQILIITVVYSLGSEVMLYGGYLLLMSLVTSVLVGYIAKRLIDYKHLKLNRN